MTYQTHHLVQSIYSFIRQSLERCSALHCLNIKQNAKPASLCRDSEASPKDFDQAKGDGAGTLSLFHWVLPSLWLNKASLWTRQDGKRTASPRQHMKPAPQTLTVSQDLRKEGRGPSHCSEVNTKGRRDKGLRGQAARDLEGSLPHWHLSLLTNQRRRLAQPHNKMPYAFIDKICDIQYTNGINIHT